MDKMASRCLPLALPWTAPPARPTWAGTPTALRAAAQASRMAVFRVLRSLPLLSSAWGGGGGTAAAAVALACLCWRLLRWGALHWMGFSGVRLGGAPCGGLRCGAVVPGCCAAGLY